MANVIVILILFVLIGAACMYLCKEKGKGGACTGCPYSQSCVGGNCEKSSNNKEYIRNDVDNKESKDGV